MRFKNSQLYQDAVAQGADTMPTKDAVLGLLGQLALAEASPQDPDAAALLSSPNHKMKDAWEAEVAAKGLNMEVYGNLRAFKKISSKGFHQPLPIADALQQLEDMPLPEPCLQYKAPLICLLKLLKSKP